MTRTATPIALPSKPTPTLDVEVLAASQKRLAEMRRTALLAEIAGLEEFLGYGVENLDDCWKREANPTTAQMRQWRRKVAR